MGLTLKNTTIFDSTYYYFVGYVDDKSFVVNIKHEKEMADFLNRILPMDNVNVTDVKKFLLIIEGNENVNHHHLVIITNDDLIRN